MPMTGAGMAEAVRSALGDDAVTSPQMVKFFDALVAYIKANAQIEGVCTGLLAPPGTSGGPVTGTAVLPAGSIK